MMIKQMKQPLVSATSLLLEDMLKRLGKRCHIPAKSASIRMAWATQHANSVQEDLIHQILV
jgi:hypothetical protein